MGSKSDGDQRSGFAVRSVGVPDAARAFELPPASSDWSQPTLSRARHTDPDPAQHEAAASQVSDTEVDQPEAVPATDAAEELADSAHPVEASTQPELEPSEQPDEPEQQRQQADRAQHPRPARKPEPAQEPKPARQPEPAQELEPAQPSEPAQRPPVGWTARARPSTVYEQGAVNEKLHPLVVDRAADVAVAAMPIPLQVLDVGCGAGLLLAEMIIRVPYADTYVGVDPVYDVLRQARRSPDPRLSLIQGAAERLPFADASFDLVVATMTVPYWQNQQAGIAELARVVADNGRVVVVDFVGGTAKRTGRRVRDMGEMITAAGLVLERTEVLIRSVLRAPKVQAFVAAP